jgi:hypothetical protein
MFAFKKKGRITIQRYSAMNKFYAAKKFYDTKHKCIQCKKVNTIAFEVNQRTMSCKCSNCSLAISFFSDKYMTYDELFELRKKHYVSAFERDIDPIQFKLDYNALFDTHAKKIEDHELALSKYMHDKDEIVKVLHEQDINNEELNDILNNIYKINYIKMGPETIRNQLFDVEIPILN